MHASYELEIEASDGGTPPKRNTSRLLIKVLDDNDNNPSFVRKEYSVSIKEDVAVGTSLLKIEAHDLDTGINSLISYSLDNDAAGQFKIDNVTGVIKSDGYDIISVSNIFCRYRLDVFHYDQVYTFYS